jgi:hypothetical protein
VQQQVLQDVLEITARITVNVAGRLIVFHGSPTALVADLDGDNRQDTLSISLDDARALLAGTAISAIGESSVQQLDFSIPGCLGAAGTPVAAPPMAPRAAPPRAFTPPDDAPTTSPPDGRGSPPELLPLPRAPPLPVIRPRLLRRTFPVRRRAFRLASLPRQYGKYRTPLRASSVTSLR